jgi:hypothetical protein
VSHVFSPPPSCQPSVQTSANTKGLTGLEGYTSITLGNGDAAEDETIQKEVYVAILLRISRQSHGDRNRGGREKLHDQHGACLELLHAFMGDAAVQRVDIFTEMVSTFSQSFDTRITMDSMRDFFADHKGKKLVLVVASFERFSRRIEDWHKFNTWLKESGIMVTVVSRVECVLGSGEGLPGDSGSTVTCSMFFLYLVFVVTNNFIRGSCAAPRIGFSPFESVLTRTEVSG